MSDTKAVKDRIRIITARRRKAEEWSDAEVSWLNAVLAHGDRAAQGYVVRWLAGSQRMTDEAYQALVSDWARIYTKAPTDVLVTDLLNDMSRRGDARLDSVIDTCLTRTCYTFGRGVAGFLINRGDPADLPRVTAVRRLQRIAETGR